MVLVSQAPRAGPLKQLAPKARSSLPELQARRALGAPLGLRQAGAGALAAAERGQRAPVSGPARPAVNPYVDPTKPKPAKSSTLAASAPASAKKGAGHADGDY
ncbi:unnamed protein product [Prorocentrum cordatum]|uniref:Uncharacterized protein n=1 Tax=Prorocentrum cordatum TaxID=2364126 RepID=A0ABN9U3W2_9DINO|nr:unnamed protein product [Polarella glacialis]